MKEIAQDFKRNIRFQKVALNALQKATKSMLIE
jgi:histone H3/H4